MSPKRMCRANPQRRTIEITAWDGVFTIVIMSLYYQTLPPACQQQYREKLSKLGINKLCNDPFVQGESWVDSVSKWPDVEFGEIYCYLVDSPGQFTWETLKAYRSLEAYNFFHSGWVYTVYYSNLDCNDKCFLKAKVNRSQALSEKPHEAWVCKKERWYHLECPFHVYGGVSNI